MNSSYPAKKTVLKDIDPELVRSLASELKISDVLASILVIRGFTTYDECKRFFKPSMTGFFDPFLFKDMDFAAERILKALKQKERITVYGDYDVDGITSSALLCRVLRRIGAECEVYLPNRLEEGYGLSKTGIERIKERGSSLIITVDCGITGCREVEFAAEAGIDIIITDHHEPSDTLPEAVAVIDPKIEGCIYPDSNLAGAGVALKLSQAITSKIGYGGRLWSELLELAALGTASDLVPLTGENRIITTFGYQKLSTTSITGLRLLVRRQGLENKNVSTNDIVFRIAPLINATGRLGDSETALKLLTTENKDEAEEYTSKLIKANTNRKVIDDKVKRSVFETIESKFRPDTDTSIVFAHKDWHEGVIGIVASRVVERFYRPVFLFSIGSDGIAKGSGRSIENFHLFNALCRCSEYLETFGGHEAAAGAEIKAENIPAFKEAFSKVVSEEISGREDFIPKIYADAELDFSRITGKFLNILKRMKPFGPGNRRPVFFTRNVENTTTPRIVGKGHLKLKVRQNMCEFDVIGFNMGNRIDDITRVDSYSIAYIIEENEWNGRTKIQLNLKDISV